jgi:hypothetical protein
VNGYKNPNACNRSCAVNKQAVAGAIAQWSHRDLTAVLDAVDAVFREIAALGAPTARTDRDAQGSCALALQSARPDARPAIALSAATILCAPSNLTELRPSERTFLWELIKPWARRQLPFSPADMVALADCLLQFIADRRSLSDNTAILVEFFETYARTTPLPEEAAGKLRHARKFLGFPGGSRGIITSGSPAIIKQCRTLDQLTELKNQVRIDAGEAWSDQSLADLERMAAAERSEWNELLAHALSATMSKPSAKWLKEAREKLDAVGFGPFKACVLRWFPLVDKPRTKPPKRDPYRTQPADDDDFIQAGHLDLLRGLAWSSALYDDHDLARALVELALSSYRKVPGRGPRLVALGNAAVTALGLMPGTAAVGPLALLQVKIKSGSARKEIEKALNAAALRGGLPRDEIEELGVPTYGLDEVGRRRATIGECAAEIVMENGDVELRWCSPGGKPAKSPPASLKAEHDAEVKELQAAAKDAAKMLSAQRERLDSLFLARRSWSFGSWCERYRDHPLVGTIARPLIWRFHTAGTEVDGIWHEGRMVGHDGHELKELAPDTRVALWHPIGSPLDLVLAWRNWLDIHRVRQPFKQAHREIYVLTEAERLTRVYSNRFAAHILRQHQYHALCAARAWKDPLRLMVDSDFPPSSRSLPAWGLRAEFWVEGAGETFGLDTNATGTYLHLVTDQVRFYPIQAQQHEAHARGGGYRPAGFRDDEALALEEVPALVFSEVMRDIDLFVGVASVGNDPTWSDGGPDGRFRTYWQSFSFGALSATAQTRKAVLERLIPRLKIGPRCSFNGRFLVVRGDLRTYGIHLGSGNILMEPDNRYLCIVPKQTARSSTERLFLPFEGDSILSVILSKAFLLAEDTKITDSTIMAQIRRVP